MSRMNKAVGAASIAMVLAAVQASACGDSLFRSGFGLNIPVVKVEHPANVVIFTPTKHDVFFDDAKVAARLDKSGHKVTVVHETTQTAAGEMPTFDVVLARDSDFEVARQAMGPQVANSVFVPVHEGFAKSSDRLSLSENAQLQQILKVLKLALDTVRTEHPTA
jgi:hypothetical protein